MVRQTSKITHAYTLLSDQAEDHEAFHPRHLHTSGPERLSLPGVCVNIDENVVTIIRSSFGLCLLQITALYHVREFSDLTL